MPAETPTLPARLALARGVLEREREVFIDSFTLGGRIETADKEGRALIAECTAAIQAIDEAMAERERLRDALADMLSGWRYIRSVHGDLSGVGWARCEASATAALTPRGAAP